MITVIQGSTPKITCTIPESIDMELIVNIWLFVSQQVSYNNDRLVIDRKLDTITKDIENRTIEVTLTQEETLALEPEKNAVIQIQMYMEDGTAITSTAIWFKVLKNYKGEVITDAD
jgi:hypothetical protein